MLGADSTSQVLVDFPSFIATRPHSPGRSSTKSGPTLRAEVFMVPHHASKYGLNIGLVEAVQPAVSLISSVGGGGKYNFPHR